MALNRTDIEYAKGILNMAVYTTTPLKVEDCILLLRFFDALQEHTERPADNVKSREWRAAIYRKLLDDPDALHQFTMQAIQKFGEEALSRMVAPQLQERIIQDGIESMPTGDLANLLRESNRWTDLLEYVIENHPEWIEQLDLLSDAAAGNISEADLEEARNIGYESGFEDGYEASRRHNE